jgi:cyclopropane-fatty-acyl-phospholipid synthase
MRSTTLKQNDLKMTSFASSFLLLAKKLIRKKISGLPSGCIAINDPFDHWQTDSALPADITIEIKDMRFYIDVLLAGSNGAASAYRDGYWRCDNLVGLFQMMVRNLDHTDELESGLASLGNWWLRRRHKARSNTRQGSQENIHAHYDLGNDMFQLFLDKTMTYSSGFFLNEQSTLEDASIEKLDRICRKLDLKPHHRLIEIGSGWGSFSIHAAKNYGCHVTTITISKEQYGLAKQRIQEQGLDDRIDIKLCDYRDLTGKFDKLVSIEMIEAVGHEYLPAYFSSCASLLKNDGQMLVQAITMPDQRYTQYLKTSDFIQQFVFPGSCVPSLTAMLNAITESSDLRVNNIEGFGLHYAKTLKIWRENFMARLDDVKQYGYGDDFIHLWEYYLAYCEAGFIECYTGVVQMLMNKPAYGREALTRADSSVHL